VAGSDFPANLPALAPYPRSIPLLGPERTLARIEGEVGDSAYERWAKAVRAGRVSVSNGPLLTLSVDGKEPGSILDLEGEPARVSVRAEAWFSRPIELLEVVANGRVVATRRGDGTTRHLVLSDDIPLSESSWVAARVRGVRQQGEPDRQAHTNPAYLIKDGASVYLPEAREAVLRGWLRDVDYYKGDALTFSDPGHRRELRVAIDVATRILSLPPEPVR
jgi:hypothetical protein